MRDGRLEKLAPDRAHPVTHGFACNKGLAGLEIHHDPDRLDFRCGRGAADRLERVSWDAAIDGIAAKLREIIAAHGPNAVASYVGNPTAFNTLAGPAIGAFAAQLGTQAHASRPARRTARTSSRAARRCSARARSTRSRTSRTPISLLVFGANPRVSHGSFISIARPDARADATRASAARSSTS